MILKLTFSNFYAIKDLTTLDFYCNGIEDNTKYDAYFTYKGEKILKALMLTGDVNSGKSCLLWSIYSLTKFILEKEDIVLIEPFKFDSEQKPTTFNIEFVYQKIKYKYALKIFNQKVVYEEGYYAPKGRSILLFKRDKDSIFLHKRLLSNDDKLDLEKHLIPEESLLTTAYFLHIKLLKNFYLYFKNNIIFGDTVYERFDKSVVINKLKNKDFDNFFRQYMKVLNLSFDDYEVEYDEENNPRISVIYKTIKGVYKSRLEDESMGFNRMLFLALDIFDSLTYGRTLVIDGLGKYINYTLQHAIVTMFLDPNINVNNSQLVFTTNDIKLLSSSLLRRDEIYFVEKDEITNVSKVFCLSKFFAVRKHENIEKGYLTGRYIKSPIRDNITLKIKKASI